VIRRVGIDLIHEYGFERMSLRQLASAADLQTGSLYNYFATKQAFLLRIVCDVIEEALADAEAARDSADGPLAQLEAVVRVLVTWHTVRRKETFIALMDVRSLDATDYAHYHDIRATFDRVVAEILDAGHAAGVLNVGDSSVAAIAIMTLVTNICRWYRPDGRLAPDEIADRYVELVFAMVNAEAAAAKTVRRQQSTKRAVKARG
jgi:AcrR family transcriptional regulator